MAFLESLIAYELAGFSNIFKLLGIAILMYLLLHAIMYTANYKHGTILPVVLYFPIFLVIVGTCFVSSIYLGKKSFQRENQIIRTTIQQEIVSDFGSEKNLKEFWKATIELKSLIYEEEFNLQSYIEKEIGSP